MVTNINYVNHWATTETHHLFLVWWLSDCRYN